MPSKSQSQARLFAAAAHDPKFAKKVGVSQSVAKEFNDADTGTKMSTLPTKVKPPAKNTNKYKNGGMVKTRPIQKSSGRGR